MSFTRHLLVDGANVLHAWPELRSLAKHDRTAARSQLILRVSAIHDGEQTRVTVVFDGRGDERVVERPSGEMTFSVLYTPTAQTADEVIEHLVANAADPAACTVATDDRAERETVAAAGGHAIHADELAAWIRRCETRRTARLDALRSSNASEWRKS